MLLGCPLTNRQLAATRTPVFARPPTPQSNNKLTAVQAGVFAGLANLDSLELVRPLRLLFVFSTPASVLSHPAPHTLWPLPAGR